MTKTIRKDYVHRTEELYGRMINTLFGMTEEEREETSGIICQYSGYYDKFINAKNPTEADDVYLIAQMYRTEGMFEAKFGLWTPID